MSESTQWKRNISSLQLHWYKKISLACNVSLQNLVSVLWQVWGDRVYVLWRRILADCQVNLRVWVVQGPREKQSGQAGRVMFESGDAGRQFNDSPHPWTYKPLSTWHSRKCTRTEWHEHVHIWHVWYMVWCLLQKTPRLVKMKEDNIFFAHDPGNK